MKRKKSKNEIEWENWMRGEWKYGYFPYVKSWGINSSRLKIPDDFDECLVSKSEKVQTAPDEVFSVRKLLNVAYVTTARNWESVMPAPIGTDGYDASVREDGILKRVEMKHRFYTLKYLQEPDKDGSEKVAFLEKWKKDVMDRNGTDYIVNLFHIPGRPDKVEWAYWDAKDYVCKNQYSLRPEFNKFDKGGTTLRQECGYLLSQAIDKGGRFDGREV